MSSTLTLKLDPKVLKLAEQQAKAHHTTVPDVVAQQLRVMAQNWKTSRDNKTPTTDSLRGTVKLPADFNAADAIAEERQKKHGRRG